MGFMEKMGLGKLVQPITKSKSASTLLDEYEAEQKKRAERRKLNAEVKKRTALAKK